MGLHNHTIPYTGYTCCQLPIGAYDKDEKHNSRFSLKPLMLSNIQ